ncbi:MAG: transposase, partial [Chloroflexota bacterium]
MSCVVELRGAATDLLHPVVREGLATLRGALSAVGRSLPRHVQNELEGFLGCGDPANGFAWLHGKGCDPHRLVTFACKGRGFCPRCGGRRMAATAAGWMERVLPHVATRQWVVTVPWKRRWLLARRPERARGVHSVALRAIERWYGEAGGAPKTGRTGSVTATQRFGSALNLNLHFHCIFLDGIYTRGADDRLSFRRVVPHTEDIERLVVRIAEACEAWLSRQGFGDEDEGDADDGDDAQAVIQQASLLGQAALGERAGKRARRVQVLGGNALALPPRCANVAGYSLHAGVGFKATDRAGLERLCGHILRPPLAKDRLQRREDGSIAVGLKRVWSDGTSALVFSPAELVERLVALVPPPRANQVIYRGVLAANAAWRAEVVSRPPPPDPGGGPGRGGPRGAPHPPR